jgi:hypothetical protein
MLTALSPTSIVNSPRLKRGGQPRNSNALKHGLYSSLTPHSRLYFVQPFQKPLQASALLQSMLPGLIQALNHGLDENRLQLLTVFENSKPGLSFVEVVSRLRAASLLVGIHLKLVKTLHELGGRQEHLRSLARDLPALLRWEFKRRGIPIHPPFVPQKLENFHANLPWEPCSLTDAQWQLIQPTFVTLRSELDSSRKYERHKTVPLDRLLFEGILWKITGGLRWRDLPDKFPVRLCQDLYWALIRTGHMQFIYAQLLGHLNACGGSGLVELVEQGCFVIKGNRVELSSSETLTWEKYTTLFLLQQAFHARLCIQREADLDRRRRGNFFRLPSLPKYNG